MSTQILPRESTEYGTRVAASPAQPGDHDLFSHYVQKTKILESAMTGNQVIALCGKIWVPGRDPEKFPVCPDCKSIYQQMKPGEDKDG